MHTIALKEDVEEVVDWSPEPLRDLSEAREDTLDDEKNEEVGEVVWTSAGSLLRLGQRQHNQNVGIWNLLNPKKTRKKTP